MGFPENAWRNSPAPARLDYRAIFRIFPHIPNKFRVRSRNENKAGFRSRIKIGLEFRLEFRIKFRFRIRLRIRIRIRSRGRSKGFCCP
jgi:hypothetical protein